MNKVALAMIVKDDTEAVMLERCLKSIHKYVDGIYVTITNKPATKLTNLLKKYGAQISHYKWDKSFERARNYNLTQIPDRFKYVIWTDADDVWRNAEGIPQLVEIMDEKSVTAIYLEYNYMIDGVSGEVMIHHPRERIIEREYFQWKGHLHETLIAKGGVNQKTFYPKDTWVDHLPERMDDEEKMNRNLEILVQSYKDEGENHDPRTEFYLARTYFDLNMSNEAEKLFCDYILHSGWDEERAQACNYLGIIAQKRQDYEQAIIHFLEASRQKAILPEIYVNLAYTYSLLEDWENTEHWLRVFSVIPEPKSTAIRIPIDNKIKYNETYFRLAVKKGNMKEAAKALSELIRIDHDNPVHEKRVESIVRMNDWIEATKGVRSLIKELKEIGEEDQIEVLLNSLPTTITENAYIAQLRNEYAKPVIWPRKSICYFTGQTMEEWSPMSLQTGIGGSETAVIQLAKEWVKQGFKVVVYGRFGSDEGLYDGVEYRNYYRFNRLDSFDTLIIWRNAPLLDIPFKAHRIFLDLHDVPENPEMTVERLEKVEKVFVKSNYHKSLLRSCDKGRFKRFNDDKVVVIPNGYSEDLVKAVTLNTDLNNKKIIYSSSYDRGLEDMLMFGWPIIKKEVPEATLDIYYGWNLFDSFHRGNKTKMFWKAKMVELMKQPGITEHGRVGQKELVKAKADSAIHYYGTTFEEIDCISVRESAAVGAVPATTDYAALCEKTYCDRTEGDPVFKETQQDLAQRIVYLLKNPSKLKQLREAFMKEAKKEGWVDVSSQWLPYFE